MTEGDREDRALEALIVVAMRGIDPREVVARMEENEAQTEIPDVASLPELTREERAAIRALDSSQPGFIDRLIAQVNKADEKR